jgi:hypothetical protein
MKDFKESQSGWVVIALLLPVHLLITYLYVNKLGDTPINTTGYVALSGFFVVLYLLLYRMITRVTNETISVSYGVGIIKKTIAMRDIKSVGKVKNPWYYGWGIRLIPNGWLYNISGSDAVELTFTHKQTIFRIGTKDPVALKNEILKRLTP